MCSFELLTEAKALSVALGASDVEKGIRTLAQGASMCTRSMTDNVYVCGTVGNWVHLCVHVCVCVRACARARAAARGHVLSVTPGASDVEKGIRTLHGVCKGPMWGGGVCVCGGGCCGQL